jgi:hypothetical protein
LVVSINTWQLAEKHFNTRKHIQIMRWKLGLKSGAVAGAVYGAIAAIIGIIYMVVMREEVIQRIQAAIPSGTNIPISTEQLYTISLVFSLPSGIIMGVITGMVFGLVFLLMREELLGKNDRKKGFFLALLLLVCLALAEVFVPENAVGAFFMLRFSYLPLAPISAGAFLFLGYLTGMFFERFEKRKKK